MTIKIILIGILAVAAVVWVRLIQNITAALEKLEGRG